MNINPAVAAVVGDIDFDPDTLHAKYLAERDKRLRPDGNAQYVEVKAEFSHYVEDPYVEPGFTRAPVFDEVEFAIIGGGFGGLLMGDLQPSLGASKASAAPPPINTCIITDNVDQLVTFYGKIQGLNAQRSDKQYADFHIGVGLSAIFSAEAQQS